MADHSIGRQVGQLPAVVRTVTQYPDGTKMITTLTLMSPQRGIAVARYTLTVEALGRVVKFGPMSPGLAIQAERAVTLNGGDHD